MRLMIHRWLQAVPYTDAHLHRQATIIQLLLIILAGATSIAIPITLVMPEASLPRSVIAVTLACYLISAGVALALVRSGALTPATRLMITGLALILLISLIGYRSDQSHSVILGTTVPMILAALLSDRRTLIGVAIVSAVGMICAAFLDSPWPLQPGPGWFVLTLIESGLLVTLLVIGVIAVCLDQFGLHLRQHSEEQRVINRRLEEAAVIAARNERSLRRSEARFNAFINQSPAASWITDADGTMIYMSAAYYRLFDLPVGNPIGRSLFELYPVEFAQQYLDNVRTVAASRQLLTSIKRAPRSRGGVGDFLVYEFLLPDEGDRPLVGGVAIDLSDQLSAERALRSIEDQYRLIADHTGDLICLINPQAAFAYISPSFQSHLGYPPEQLVGQFAFAHVHPDDLEHVQQRFGEAFISGLAEATFRFRRADGAWRWFEARANIVTWHDAAHALIIGRDVTERRQLEQQLAQAQKMESIGRLAGGVAHDFNNMLAVVRGSAGLIAEDLPPDHPSQEDLAAIVSAADRAAQMTHQLIAFSSRQVNTPQTLDLKKLLAEMDPLLRRLAGARVEMTTTIDAGLWPIRGDRA
jgi:PAS domain S-box-containing protein